MTGDVVIDARESLVPPFVSAAPFDFAPFGFATPAGPATIGAFVAVCLPVASLGVAGLGAGDETFDDWSPLVPVKLPGLLLEFGASFANGSAGSAVSPGAALLGEADVRGVADVAGAAIEMSAAAGADDVPEERSSMAPPPTTTSAMAAPIRAREDVLPPAVLPCVSVFDALAGSETGFSAGFAMRSTTGVVAASASFVADGGSASKAAADDTFVTAIASSTIAVW